LTALVTGAGGFLGGALVRRLLDGGATDLRCLVRTGQPWFEDAGVEVVRGTLNRRDDCERAVRGVGLVYHLAAAAAGAPADMYLNTVVATRNLLDAIVAAGPGIRLVHVSSFGVYGVAQLPTGAVISESTPLEPYPERRDTYSQTKLRQEELVREYAETHSIPLTVLRPGVIYGPGGPAISSRVGLFIGKVFLYLGRRNPLPLTYVENCADAIICAGREAAAVGETFNVVDDWSTSARTFLKRYRREVAPIRCVPVPGFGLRLLSWMVEGYSRRSRGQLPAFLTPYRSATSWKRTEFDNRKLTGLGWAPRVPVEEGLRRHFAYLAKASAAVR